ncbi:uncharacterized protein LOC112087986 [Eutrema salsugineum]|uniref:uncharacterized protein LOC112087986 n=1 Tax=Eutrema salsugineum TaxID=72664 RepID=UPI000CED5F17|nr:uncharacterized protein LOC112087986 [Eutrema salsugineum]
MAPRRKKKKKKRGAESASIREGEAESASNPNHAGALVVVGESSYHDDEDDCQVGGDTDCEDINDSDEDNGEGNGETGLVVRKDVNINIADDFAAIDEDGEKTDDDSGDDIWDDDKIPDPLSSDDEAERNDDEDRAIPERRENPDDPEMLIQYEKTYNSAADFKLALLTYSLKTRYDINFYKSESTRVAAKCCYIDSVTKVECPWKVYASYEKKKHKLQVNTYINEHTCVRSGYSKMLKVSAIATLYEERLRLNPKITKIIMAEEIKREYNLEVTPDQCTKVLRARKASHESHFARIWDYQADVLKKNQDSEFDIEIILGPIIGSKQRFFRLYICFKSQKESWKQTCRPIIGLDGAFLKWDIMGHLLAAVGRDGDNRIVSIAWAVVEIENDDNWDWFVKKLCHSLGL